MSTPPDFDEAAVGPGRRLSLLEGVRVLDLTHFLAGPFGSMVLADMGASVLKLEQLSGDSIRRNPVFFHQGDSAYFMAVNRNKDSIAVDLRTDAGQEILRRLVTGSDVVLDNLRAPQRASLGLSFEDLERINPKIVCCSITGFGSDGPYSDRPAYDLIVEALGGIMSVTGPVGGPSVRAGVPIGDIVAGLYAAIGILGGLQSLRTTGRGTHVDISMLDCQVSLLSYLAQYYLTGGMVASHQGKAHVSIPTYNTFVTKDGREIVIAANTEGMWRSLCQVLGREDLLDDERFAGNAARLAHRDDLVPLLQEEMARHTADELYGALVDAGVPAAPINPVDAVFADPQVLHRDMVVRAPHRGGGDFVTLGSPVKSERSPGEGFRSPPGLGGQTAQVLTELGFDAEEIAELRRAGVVNDG
ncbi:CaiB/BaiF CoA transferase family protein [Pseudonocardia sp. GCM10023141]|uniref:CaiB/BaiF CoA transferase family protein n=1 Tax=Pseudonocardia sp. GCM10023141 TaxID=3252653 RepID=UPI003609918C